MPPFHIVRPLVIASVVSLILIPAHAANTTLRAQAQAVFKRVSKSTPARHDAITDARVQLGRLLFFETRVSVDGTVSCARCHQPALYGTDALSTSIGATHRVHPRHAPTVLNAALQFVQHWRGDRTSVEDQATQALIAPPSYGNPSYESAMAKLKAISRYRTLFGQAFPDTADPITPEHWGQAIGAYVRTLVTPSPFDAFLGGDDHALSPAAQAGLRTFMRIGCATCHNGVGIGGAMYQKFGIVEEYWQATGSTTIDKGRIDVTRDPADAYVFKVPSLRNVAMTPPYFHDGSVAALPAAVRVMAQVQLGRTLADKEVADIIAFLETLTGPLPQDFATTPVLPAGNFSPNPPTR